jgi:hypothetical protein
MSLPISGFQRPLLDWRQESINKVEPRPGVYEFYDSLEFIIFVGGTNNLRETLQNFYNTGFSARPCLRGGTHFRTEYTDKWESALYNHMVVFKATSGGQLPECNK